MRCLSCACLMALLIVMGCNARNRNPEAAMNDKPAADVPRTMPPLSDAEKRIILEKGTERAFTGKYWNEHGNGLYRCVCCGNDLFSSSAQFDSGTGWPSFYQPVAPENVRNEEDNSFFSRRTEVLCSRCDAHLGHVFPDGPKPTGLRYCMNSASLDFVRGGPPPGDAGKGKKP